LLCILDEKWVGRLIEGKRFVVDLTLTHIPTARELLEGSRLMDMWIREI
jgi:hypothetical protein